MKTARNESASSAAPLAPHEGRTAIVAGGGRLPLEVADALRQAGEEPLVLMIAGEADRALTEYDHLVAPLGSTARYFRVLRQRGARRIVLAGGIRNRPRLRDLRFDMTTLAYLPRIAWSLMRKGDDGLLSAIVAIIERLGLEVAGAHQVAPSLLARRGGLGRHDPSARDWIDIRAGWHGAKALGALDIGQGAISVAGLVVRRESRDGTDAMLEGFRAERRARDSVMESGGVLVKCSKPGQELRADLPAIGPGTVAMATKAGLAGIAVEADRTLILQREETIAAADAAGIFIVAVTAAEIAHG